VPGPQSSRPPQARDTWRPPAVPPEAQGRQPQARASDPADALFGARRRQVGAFLPRDAAMVQRLRDAPHAVPTLFVHGRGDALVPLERWCAARRRVSGALPRRERAPHDGMRQQWLPCRFTLVPP